MRSLTVTPGIAAAAKIREDLPEPERGPGELLVEGMLVGICGTDHEIIAGSYGQAPSGCEHLVIGHEALGRVLAADPDGSFAPGDWVVGIVRRPDPVPCACCAAGEWDMCLNGKYTERGIRGLHGYARERYTLERAFAVRVPQTLGIAAVLLEPASVVAKAWEQVERISARFQSFSARRVLVTGAGPIGLLAALIAVQRGYRVTVLDRVENGLKPDLVRSLGAAYATGLVSRTDPKPEVVIECTGNTQLVVDILATTARNSTVCLAGISSGARKVALAASDFNDSMVLENDLVFGSVNANRRHYALALEALEQADRTWLSALITRRVPLSCFEEAFMRRKDDIKVVIDLQK
jgi:threonine dehydrogenase-like Zn-dependent dehydrogenase